MMDYIKGEIGERQLLQGIMGSKSVEYIKGKTDFLHVDTEPAVLLSPLDAQQSILLSLPCCTALALVSICLSAPP